MIRTVLGDIPAAELGVCYAHEHLILDPSLPNREDPTMLLDSVDNGVAELLEFHAHGGRAMVDSMPCDAGRNVLKLAEISRRSGVHILAPTGLHLEIYYRPDHWSHRYSEDELAELFIADIEQGIDARDYTGPLVERTPHRAGLIKVASGLDRLSDRQAKAFRAAAAAHRRTGAPILTHTEQGTAALAQVELFREHGVDLGHVVLSHTDRHPDPAYHREILASGVRVEYDSAFRWRGRTGNPTLDLVLGLIDEFPHQIMLGMDAARRHYWKSYGGSPGLAFLLTDFTAQLRAGGLSEAHWDKIFRSTPAASYAFATPS